MQQLARAIEQRQQSIAALSNGQNAMQTEDELWRLSELILPLIPMIAASNQDGDAEPDADAAA